MLELGLYLVNFASESCSSIELTNKAELAMSLISTMDFLVFPAIICKGVLN